MQSVPLRNSVFSLAVVCVLLMCTVSIQGETTLVVALTWDVSAPESKGFVAAAEAYSALHPEVDIQFISGAGWYGPGSASTAKLMGMVAGGVSPDLAMVDGMMVPQYAHSGLLMPLDDYIAIEGVDVNEFIPATWAQAHWLGRQYAMTLQVDPNFALVWNKDMFNQAGLNAEQGPETLAEYESHFRKLTQMGADGRLEQFGHQLWDVYGGANTVYTWGWMFGGEFYDAETQTVTAANPHNIEALEFVRDYHERYQPLLSANIHFPDGKEAMRLAVSANVKHWREQFPSVDIGASFEPYNESSGSPNPSWIGGHAMGILPDAPNPDLAWDFLHFMTGTPEGTTAFARASGWIPAYLPSPAHMDFLDDPIMSVYLEIAQQARYARPAMPVVSEYGEMLEKAFVDVMNGLQQPGDALAFVEEQIQMLLDEQLAKE